MNKLKKIVCPFCGKTLCYTDSGKLEIKCTRKSCKKIIKFEIGDESVKYMIIQ
jgi:ribosomal protein S27E